METNYIKEDCPYFVNGVCMEYLDGSCENHKCDLKIIDELNKKLFELEQECENLKDKLEKIRITIITNDSCPSIACPEFGECRSRVIDYDEKLLKIIEDTNDRDNTEI